MVLRFLIALCVLSSLLFAPMAIADEEGGFSEESMLGVFYPDFLTLESFWSIQVTLEGTAEEIGLDADKLTGFLKLKYKNNFADFPYKDPGDELYEKLGDEEYLSTIGSLAVRVWVVGTDYPVAYHIVLHAGSANNRKQYEDESLGYGSKEHVKENARTVIAGMVEELAIDFFKTRGEL